MTPCISVSHCQIDYFPILQNVSTTNACSAGLHQTDWSGQAKPFTHIWGEIQTESSQPIKWLVKARNMAPTSRKLWSSGFSYTYINFISWITLLSRCAGCEKQNVGIVSEISSLWQSLLSICLHVYITKGRSVCPDLSLESERFQCSVSQKHILKSTWNVMQQHLIKTQFG